MSDEAPTPVDASEGDDVLRLPMEPAKWTVDDCRAAMEKIQTQNAELAGFRSGRGDIAENFWRQVFVAAIPVMSGQGVAEYADRCVKSYLSRYHGS